MKYCDLEEIMSDQYLLWDYAENVEEKRFFAVCPGDDSVTEWESLDDYINGLKWFPFLDQYGSKFKV